MQPNSKKKKEDGMDSEREEWYKKRRYLAIFTRIMTCLTFFEYSAVSISSLFYYKVDFKVCIFHLTIIKVLLTAYCLLSVLA